MRKLIILFIIMLGYQIILYAGWRNTGNCERINAYNSNISKFVIDENNKFLYTIDYGNTIKKWDYSTGENIWTKIIQPDAKDEYLGNNTFLSSDAKTYLTFAINNSVHNMPTFNIFIHDINTDNKIDSIFYPNNLLEWGGSGYCFGFPKAYFADIILDKEKLITYVNYEQHCNGPYTSNDYTGLMMIFQKSDTGFVALTSPLELNFSVSQIFLNTTCDNLYFQGYYSGNYYKNNKGSSEGNGLINGIMSLNTKGLIKISDYKYSNEATYPNPPTITESGVKMSFSSAFYDVLDSSIYLLLGNLLYKYDLFLDTLTKMYALNDYSSNESLMIYQTDNQWFFNVIKEDSLKIYVLSNSNFAGSLGVDSIKHIELIRNSNDNKFLFLTDSIGNLYRINYTAIFNKVSVKEPTLIDFIITPNPASDFLYTQNNFANNKIEIYSILGIKVLESEWKEKIDVSALAPGVYFVKVGYKLSKFIKI
jgi:hypothetical protein